MNNLLWGEILKGSVADKGGLKTGDKIISVNGIEVNYFQTLVDVLSENKGKTVVTKISRNGESLEKEFEVGEDGQIGILFRIHLTSKIKLWNMAFSKAFQKVREWLLPWFMIT